MSIELIHSTEYIEIPTYKKREVIVEKEPEPLKDITDKVIELIKKQIDELK